MHSRCFYPRRALCSDLLAWKSCLQWTVWLCKSLGMRERTAGGVAGLLEDTCCCVFPLFKLTCSPLTSLSCCTYLHRTKLFAKRTLCFGLFLLLLQNTFPRSLWSVEQPEVKDTKSNVMLRVKTTHCSCTLCADSNMLPTGGCNSLQKNDILIMCTTRIFNEFPTAKWEEG